MNTEMNIQKEQFFRLIDEIWAFFLDAIFGVRLRENLPINSYPQISFEEKQNEIEILRNFQSKLHKIDITALDLHELLLSKNIEWHIKIAIEAFDFFWLQFPVLPYTSTIKVIHECISQWNIQSDKEFDDYLEFVKGYPNFIEKIIVKLHTQEKMGILIPRSEIPLVKNYLSHFIQEPQKSDFWPRKEHLQHGIYSNIETKLDVLFGLIKNQINPKLQEVIGIFDEKYQSKALDHVGLMHYPQGGDYYRFLIRSHLTLDLSPEEIHSFGLKQVKLLNAQLHEIQKLEGFTGSLSQYHEYLMSQSQFYGKNHDEVKRRYEKYLGWIKPKLNQLFTLIPQAPCRVDRLDPRFEETWTFGFYKPPYPNDPIGIYFYNGKDLEHHPLLKAEGLIFHELIPGHHFQIALAQELPLTHKIQKYLSNTGYVEGWADYAFMLGEDLNLYTDPYDRYGKILLEKEAAIRLVVDTGLNALNWSEEEAKKYMSQEFFGPMQQIETEVVRYGIDLPAQSLAYRLGSLQFCKLREKFKDKLKDKFDIRKFHDEILKHGPLPFPVLEWYLEEVLLK